MARGEEVKQGQVAFRPVPAGTEVGGLYSPLPAGHDAALGDEWGEASYLLGDARHESVCQALIFEAFVDIVEKSSTEKRVMEEGRA